MRFNILLLIMMLLTSSSYGEEPPDSFKPSPEMMESAKKAIPQDLDVRIEKEKKRIVEEVFPGTREYLQRNSRTSEKSTETTIKGSKRCLAEDERVYIFISSSVPIETLRNYAVQSDRAREDGIYMVLRGFVDGMEKVRPTLEFVRSIILEDKGCNGQDCSTYGIGVMIDPLLFERYDIENVPAIVYVHETNNRVGIDSKGPFYVVYGDIPLDEAAEYIDREAHINTLGCLIRKIRRGD